MSGQDSVSQSAPVAPEVHVYGVRLPYIRQWLYRVSVDGVLKDEINSSEPWSTKQMLDVQRGYTEALTGYIFGGVPLEGWTPPTNPTIRKPIFEKRRRTMKAVEE